MKLLHFVKIFDYVKWLFLSSLKRAKVGFRIMLKYFEINKSFMCSNLFCYYIKQIDPMLPCVCSVIDHRRGQNVVRTSVILGYQLVCHFIYSYHILTSSVINCTSSQMTSKCGNKRVAPKPFSICQ